MFLPLQLIWEPFLRKMPVNLVWMCATPLGAANKAAGRPPRVFLYSDSVPRLMASSPHNLHPMLTLPAGVSLQRTKDVLIAQTGLSVRTAPSTAQFFYCTFSVKDCTLLNFDHAFFYRCSFNNLQLCSVYLSNSVFVESSFVQTKFPACSVFHNNRFYGCRLNGADLTGIARLDGLRFAPSCVFNSARGITVNYATTPWVDVRPLGSAVDDTDDDDDGYAALYGPHAQWQPPPRVLGPTTAPTFSRKATLLCGDLDEFTVFAGA